MLTYLLLLTGLAAVGSIVGSTLRTGVAPMPGTPAAHAAMLDLLPLQCDGTIIEAGSGWGGLAIAAAQRYPNARIIAYERSLLPWAVSRLRQRFHPLPNLVFLQEDYIRAPFWDAAAIICYLSPRGMERLYLGAQAGRFSGLLVSNTFALNGHTPERVVRLNDLYQSPIYAYRL